MGLKGSLTTDLKEANSIAIMLVSRSLGLPGWDHLHFAQGNQCLQERGRGGPGPLSLGVGSCFCLPGPSCRPRDSTVLRLVHTGQ